MRVRLAPLLAGLGIALVALAAVPSAQAMQLPPPCQTASLSTCCPLDPAFAPCCNVVTCPPVEPRCPAEELRTSDLLAYLGPHAGVVTHDDCSADVCVDSSYCDARRCDAQGECCTFDGTRSACTTIVAPACATPVGPALAVAAMAMPVPRVSYALHDDCSVTVYETYDCPNGFWDQTTHRTVGPVDVYADSCAPQCACMPLEVAALGLRL